MPLTQVQQTKIAFAGNPNVGKTALINAIANSRLKVGNWPGVTVEKREASLQWQSRDFQLVDLPGTYSLSPFTIEERVCRNYLFQERPELVINVLDASNLRKGLYLSFQLLDMELPLIMALNMWDEFESRAYALDIEGLSQALGVPLIPTVGPQGVGCDALRAELLKEHARPNFLRYPEAIENELQKLQEQIQSQHSDDLPSRWLALRLLNGDQDLGELLEDIQPLEELAHQARERLAGLYPDLARSIRQHREGEIERLCARFITAPQEPKPELTDWADRLFLNEWTGIPAFLGVLFLVFKLTFDVSTPFVDWIDGFFNGFLARWAGLALDAVSAPAILSSLVREGIIGGVGLVLTFIPILMFLYLFLALLEESGYMARAAFLMDRFMYRFGLHGKSFVPLLVGFGCNVPGVYATRALENETDRKITVAVMSFMSCGAKLPIYALFTAVFFQRSQALVIMAMYLLGIAVAIGWSIILRRTRFRSEIPVFIMELPPYRMPTFSMLWQSIWLKTSSFIRQAGTVIAISMLLLWSLVNLPYGAPPEKTVLGVSARAVSPLFVPQGFGQRWEPVAAILPGFMAKEMVVGTLGVVMSVQQEDQNQDDPRFLAELGAQAQGLGVAAVQSVGAVIGNIVPTPLQLEAADGDSMLTQAVRRVFTPLTAFSYMVFNLLLLSCISVVGAMVAEFGGRYFGLVFAITTGTAYVMSFLVYQVGRLLGYT